MRHELGADMEARRKEEAERMKEFSVTGSVDLKKRGGGGCWKNRSDHLARLLPR